MSPDEIILPAAPTAPEEPKVTASTPPGTKSPQYHGNLPFKGWKADQERWVKETGRWGL